jgi:hypothetical protein
MNEQAYEGPTVPKEYAGKWIVWDFDRTKIIASGNTLKEAEQAAAKTCEERPVFSKVPKGRLIGGRV